MRHFLLLRYTGPLVALGVFVAIVCLAGSWYINRLQADLARAIRDDAAGMQAAVKLQVHLRNLRVHALVLVADRTSARLNLVKDDLARVDTALDDVQRTAKMPEDVRLAKIIQNDYAEYRRNLRLDELPTPTGSMADLARWSDGHHMGDLLVPCQELAKRQDERMKESLSRSEVQTAWAGRVLLVLGLVGILSGLLSGYVTARMLTRRVAQLFVRVHAVQAHLDQDVGAMTIQNPPQFGDLDKQLDRVVERVSAVCQRLQEQERSLLRAEQLAAVGQLAASVAHEIRNPLTGVKFLLQAAARPNNSVPLSVDRLQLLLQEVGRIERTVQALMDFANAPPSDRHMADLRIVVQGAIDIAQSRAEAKSVVIRKDLAKEPLWAQFDKDQMTSLLTNLLYNGIDAAPVGGEVSMSIAPNGEHGIKVTVSDNGPGIDTAISGRLFEPFVTTKSNGTGLGLTIAQRIAREHGGTLAVTNEKVAGACFVLILPAAETSDDQVVGG